MNKQFEYEIPSNVKDIILSDGYYVKMNNNYTATVRDLVSFIWAINNCDPDENFGIVTNKSNDKNSEKFFPQMMQIIYAFKGFAIFNREFAHQFVQCEEANETISIRTKGGKRITISVIEMANCADIAFHDSPIEPMNNGSKDVPQFEIIGFNCGATPIPRTPVTIATIMFK
jgi:hypothetical protein